MRRILSTLGLTLAVVTTTPAARAQTDEPDLASYRPLVAADYALLGFFSATALYFAVGLDQPQQPNWADPILYDEPLRDSLRASSRDGRVAANTVSNILVAASYAMLVSDALLVGGLSPEHDWEETWHLAVIDMQALALTFALTEVGKAIAARERPDVEPCRRDPDYSSHCKTEANKSFPSGHSSTTATVAGLVCVNHLRLDIYGSTGSDVAACAAASAAALTTGALRIVADRHYATDVTGGLVLGGAVGAGWPLLVHADSSEPTSTTSMSWTVVPAVTPQSQSVFVSGVF